MGLGDRDYMRERRPADIDFRPPRSGPLPTWVSQPDAYDRRATCAALDQTISGYDAQARQPQSGQMQDWISSRRKAARDQQFQLRC